MLRIPELAMPKTRKVGSVEEDEFFFFDDSDGELGERYKDKLEILEDYKADEEVEESRQLTFLDGLRHEHYPDDVMVYLKPVNRL